MPELPDLEVFSENLIKRTGNKKIAALHIFNRSKVNQTEDGANALWVGKAVVNISRTGKELFFHTEEGDVFAVHLMLHGKIDIVNTGSINNIGFKVMSLDFEDNSSLVFSDMQGLCKVTFSPSAGRAPDALSREFTFDYLVNIAKKNARKNVKAFIIDQNVVKGIGNAYADEILYAADISPESTVGYIPAEYLERLYKAIPEVLSDAIVQIKRISPDIISGEERSFLHVHNRSKKRTDDGEPIIVRQIASKTTYYTNKQKVFNELFNNSPIKLEAIPEKPKKAEQESEETASYQPVFDEFTV